VRLWDYLLNNLFLTLSAILFLAEVVYVFLDDIDFLLFFICELDLTSVDSELIPGFSIILKIQYRFDYLIIIKI
jgi:hypothetical protein